MKSYPDFDNLVVVYKFTRIIFLLNIELDILASGINPIYPTQSLSTLFTATTHFLAWKVAHKILCKSL